MSALLQEALLLAEQVEKLANGQGSSVVPFKKEDFGPNGDTAPDTDLRQKDYHQPQKSAAVTDDAGSVEKATEYLHSQGLVNEKITDEFVGPDKQTDLQEHTEDAEDGKTNRGDGGTDLKLLMEGLKNLAPFVLQTEDPDALVKYKLLADLVKQMKVKDQTSRTDLDQKRYQDDHYKYAHKIAKRFKIAVGLSDQDLYRAIFSNYGKGQTVEVDGEVYTCTGDVQDGAMKVTKEGEEYSLFPDKEGVWRVGDDEESNDHKKVNTEETFAPISNVAKKASRQDSQYRENEWVRVAGKDMQIIDIFHQGSLPRVYAVGRDGTEYTLAMEYVDHDVMPNLEIVDENVPEDEIRPYYMFNELPQEFKNFLGSQWGVDEDVWNSEEDSQKIKWIDSFASKTAELEQEAPYKSKDQQAWMHIHHPEMAKEWDKKTNFKSLPQKVSKKDYGPVDETNPPMEFEEGEDLLDWFEEHGDVIVPFGTLGGRYKAVGTDGKVYMYKVDENNDYKWTRKASAKKTAAVGDQYQKDNEVWTIKNDQGEPGLDIYGRIEFTTQDGAKRVMNEDDFNSWVSDGKLVKISFLKKQAFNVGDRVRVIKDVQVTQTGLDFPSSRSSYKGEEGVVEDDFEDGSFEVNISSTGSNDDRIVVKKNDIEKIGSFKRKADDDQETLSWIKTMLDQRVTPNDIKRDLRSAGHSEDEISDFFKKYHEKNGSSEMIDMSSSVPEWKDVPKAIKKFMKGHASFSHINEGNWNEVEDNEWESIQKTYEWQSDKSNFQDDPDQRSGSLKRKANDPIKKEIDLGEGIVVGVEWLKGETRKYKDGYEAKMHADYGYVKNTKGADWEEQDVYLGADPENAPVVHKITQLNDDGDFDEHKFMVGFSNEKEAVDMYLQHMPVEKFGGSEELDWSEFKRLMNDHQD